MKLGKIIIISGPSGVGKGLVKSYFIKNKDLNLIFSVSATTRSPREGEEDGREYFFLTNEQFDNKIKENKFLEWAEFAKNKYGTLQEYIDNIINEGKNVLLEIEIEGVKQILEKTSNLIAIWLAPPSLEELEKRLRKRATDSEEQIERRLKRAKIEMEEAKDIFEHTIINDDPEIAAEQISTIILRGKND